MTASPTPISATSTASPSRCSPIPKARCAADTGCCRKSRARTGRGAALEGKHPGESIRVQLEPEQAFGEYDTKLLRVEAAARYGAGLRIGMEVEDAFEGGAPRRYTVTDLAGDKVVLDANHPLAGMALRFFCTITGLRRATKEELNRRVSLP